MFLGVEEELKMKQNQLTSPHKVMIGQWGVQESKLYKFDLICINVAIHYIDQIY